MRAVTSHRGRPAPPRAWRGTGAPLWQQLRDDLLRRLHAGEFTSALPGEMALAADYGVSRATVRQALRGLRDAGLIDAGRGRRSRPAGQAEITEPLGVLYALVASLRQAGVTVCGVVRTLRTGPDAVIASRIGLEESAPLLYLQRLWLAGERPFALDHLWLPEAVAAPLLDADLTRTGVYRELAARTGIRLVSGSEWLHVIVPSAAQRTLLHMPAHAAAVAVDRVGRTADGPLEWRHVIIRGDRLSISADFAAQTGYRMHVRGSLPRR